MLVSCPSCGKRISDRAPACPFCKTPKNAEPPVESAPPAAPVVIVPDPPSAPVASVFDPPAAPVASVFDPPAAPVASVFDPPAAPVASVFDPPAAPVASVFDPPAVPEVVAPAPKVVPVASAPPPPPAHAKPFPPSDDPTATLPPGPLPASLLAALKGPSPFAAPGQAAPAPTPPLAPAPSAPLDPGRAALEAAEHFNAGRFADALGTADRLLSIQPRNAEALGTRAQALFKLGKREEAARAILKAIEASPDSLPMWLHKAVMEHEAGKTKQACRSAMDLVEIAQHAETESPVVDQGRQMITDFEGKGAFPDARGYLGWLGLGCVSMKAGRPEAALDFFDRAIDAASSSAHGFRWKGRALTQLDQLDEALALFEAALEIDPKDPDIHHDRGMVFAIQGDIDRAIEAFDAALALDPHHAESLVEKRNLG